MLSRLLELKQAHVKMVTLRELTRIFEKNVDDNVKVDNKLSYKQIPYSASASASADLMIEVNNTGAVFVNREKVDIEDAAAVRLKLSRVYDRQCMLLKVCESLSFVRLLHATVIVVQVVYNTFTDRTVKHQIVSDCLTRIDKIVSDRLVSPTVDLICRLGKA